jgi:cell shape-determining protein MreC
MKLDKTRLLIIALIAVVIVGMALLVSSRVFNFSGLAFDILTYVLSIVALVLAILSVVNTFRQNRTLNRMVRDVHEAIAELKEVSESNDKIEREISEEYEMNKIITDVLSEYGIGENEHVRKAIAKRASRRMKKRGL